ncbi:MAG: hypothetical protein ACRCWY_12375 [Cellulosilyticaceae bacterium]
MKKLLFVLAGIVLLLGVLLMVFNPIQKIDNLDRTNESFKVNKREQTIQHNETIYHYEIEDDTVRIIYPNGGMYWWTYVGKSGYGGWNEQYSDEGYIKGSILTDVIEATKTSKISNIPIDKIGVTIGVILLGIINLGWPQVLWEVWGLDNYICNEFLTVGLVVIRITGIFTLLLGCALWT